MRHFTASLALIGFSMVLGCSTQPTVDLDAARDALMNADRAWFEAYAASDDRPDAFVAKLVDDAYLLPPGAPLARGRDAIRSVIAELEGMPGFAVTWSPDAAVVGDAGDMGYTVGSYEMNMAGPDGPMNIQGKYLTVWQKQPDGSWLVTADMFNENAPPSPPM